MEFLQGLAVDLQTDLDSIPSVATANSSRDGEDPEDNTTEVADDTRARQKHTRVDSELEEATSRDSSSSSVAKGREANVPIFAIPLASRPLVDATTSSSQPPLVKKPRRMYGLFSE